MHGNERVMEAMEAMHGSERAMQGNAQALWRGTILNVDCNED